MNSSVASDTTEIASPDTTAIASPPSRLGVPIAPGEPDDAWLPPANQRRSIIRDLTDIFGRELWGYRGLLFELIRRDIRVRYKQAVMGFAWAVLVPTLVVVAGALVRVAIAFVGGRSLGVPTKLLAWR